jgi:hypothetical protein
MSRFTLIGRWSLALVVALVALGASFGSTFAAPAGPQARAERGYRRLERALKVEQQRLTTQDERLNRATMHAGKIDALIAKLKAKGKDTAALEQAVAAFRSGIANARVEWQAASDTLAGHGGFDASAKVDDAAQAEATLKDAHAHMQQVHEIMRGAYRDLHAAVAAYRKANREAAEPPAPPAP